MRVTFCADPTSRGGRFSPTYERAPAKNFASLCAGDPKFQLGGGTLCKQFQKDLHQYGWHETAHYSRLHEKLFKDCAKSDGLLSMGERHCAKLQPDVLAAFALPSRVRAGSKTGVVFIDIFKADRRVHDHPKNVGMVYTVGPDRRACPDDATFLAEVLATAEGVSQACCRYNEAARAGAHLPEVEELRVCLVSGGAFAGSVPKLEVAKALISGLALGWAPSAPVLNFAFDEDIFGRAWAALGGPAVP